MFKSIYGFGDFFITKQYLSLSSGIPSITGLISDRNISISSNLFLLKHKNL